MNNEEKHLNDKISSLEEKIKAKGVNPKKLKTDKQLKKLKHEKRRLENKLMRVVTKAGVSWTSWISLLEIADSIDGSPLPFDTACWAYNEYTKKERIIFSTKILKQLPVRLLELVFKHEMLHKSMYRGIPEIGNQQLLNFALDSAINKILWLSSPKHMKQLADWMWPKDSENRLGFCAILNPGIETDDFDNMSPQIRSIVEEIFWVSKETLEKSGIKNRDGMSCCDYYDATNKFGNKYIPDPISIYNKLSALLSKEDKKKIKNIYACLKEKDKASNVRGGTKNFRATDKQSLKDEKIFCNDIIDSIKNRAYKQYGGRRGCYSRYSDLQDIDSYFKQFVYCQKDAETEGLNDFIARWETLKQIESVCDNIHKTFRRVSAIEPYPNDLTRTGFELVTLGVSSPSLPYFFNISSEGSSGKKKICCYLDCSPSMEMYIPYMLYIIDYIDSCEEVEIAGGAYNGKYVFSEKIEGIGENEWEDFKNGKVKGGYGTSFESVAVHAIDRIENDQVDIILVLTDGFSSINQQTIERFNESGKKCYTVYFESKDYSYYHERYRNHRRNGNYGMTNENKMFSDLDKLNGESFTIWNCK